MPPVAACRPGVVLLLASLLLAADAPAPPEFAHVIGIRGAVVADIVMIDPGSVADNLGLRPGDLVLAFNGRPLKEFRDLEAFTTEMRLAAIRGKAVLDILKHYASSDSYTPRQVSAVLRVRPDDPTRTYVGMACGFSYIVLDVLPGGAGDRMELKPGDFVEEVNGRHMDQIQSSAGLDKLVQQIRATPPVELSLLVMRWSYQQDGKRVGRDARRVRSTLEAP